MNSFPHNIALRQFLHPTHIGHTFLLIEFLVQFVHFKGRFELVLAWPLVEW